MFLDDFLRERGEGVEDFEDGFVVVLWGDVCVVFGGVGVSVAGDLLEGSDVAFDRAGGHVVGVRVANVSFEVVLSTEAPVAHLATEGF